MRGNEVKWGKQVVNRGAVVPGRAGHTWVAGSESGPASEDPVWLLVCLEGPGPEGTVVWCVLGHCVVHWRLAAAVATEQGHGKVWSAGLGTRGRWTGTLICRVTLTHTHWAAGKFATVAIQHNSCRNPTFMIFVTDIVKVLLYLILWLKFVLYCI